MNPRLTAALDRWLRFPRVVLLYLSLPVITAIPMFIGDSGNPVRAFGTTLWLCLPLALVSVIVAVVLATLGVLAMLPDRKCKGVFSPIFHGSFILTWLISIVVTVGAWLTAD